MTVKETIIVCQILNDVGYGDYILTVESGYCPSGKFPNYINKDEKYINMEGLYPPTSRDVRENPDIETICDKIKEALESGDTDE